jgi:hypothetical protein
MPTNSDETSIFICYRCMNEWEIYTYLVKYRTKKCNLCHRPMCGTCMKDVKNKQQCFICLFNPEKRTCWQCEWNPKGSKYERLINLHKHLNIYHPDDYRKKYRKTIYDEVYNFPY